MRRLLCVVLLLRIFVCVQSPEGWAAAPADETVVSAAISLKYAFQEIGKTFQESRMGSKVIFNFASSGNLARQIIAGAPGDVYASADPKDMDDLDGKGFIIAQSRFNFVMNAVVLVVPAKPFIQVETWEALRMEPTQRIVIGNPKTVPAGRYAHEVLNHLGLWNVIQKKLIFAEHVRQTLDYVARGEVDAGIVYSTDAMARSKEVKVVLTTPPGSHRPIIYPMGLVKGSRNDELARAMGEFGATLMVAGNIPVEQIRCLFRYTLTPAAGIGLRRIGWSSSFR